MSEDIKIYGPRENFVYATAVEGVAGYRYENSYFEYIGEWVNGVKAGKGRLNFGTDSFYEGDFAAGEMTGKGKRVYTNGSSYEGDFVSGEYNGKGVFINEQYRFEGDFLDNCFHGEGSIKYTNGSSYEGSFAHHKKHGQGKFKCEQFEYQGNFDCNIISGIGVMLYQNGDRFEGGFVNGKRDGYGKMFYQQTGFTIVGEWKADEIDYNPTQLILGDLPNFTPGLDLPDIAVTIEGASGETGRQIQFCIEIGRQDQSATVKKPPSKKKQEAVVIEPKFLPLKDGATHILISSHEGVVIFPSIYIPTDAENQRYTFHVVDMSDNPLQPLMADFLYIPILTERAGPAVKKSIAKPPPKRPASSLKTAHVKGK